MLCWVANFSAVWAMNVAISFDLVDLTSTAPDATLISNIGFYAPLVQDGNEPPVTSAIVDGGTTRPR